MAKTLKDFAAAPSRTGKPTGTKPAAADPLARFSGWAGLPTVAPADPAPAAALPVLRRPQTRAEMAAELAAHPGFASARQAAGFALTSADIAPKAATRAANSAAKPGPDTAAGMAAFALAAARRTGALR